MKVKLAVYRVSLATVRGDGKETHHRTETLMVLVRSKEPDAEQAIVKAKKELAKLKGFGTLVSAKLEDVYHTTDIDVP